MASSSNIIRPPQSVIESNRRNNTGLAKYRFPESIGPHAIVLNFKEYTHSSVGGGEIKSSMVLPLPRNLLDTYNVNLNAPALGVLGAGALDVANFINNNPGQARAAGAQVFDGIKSTIDNMSMNSVGSTSAGEWGSAARYFQRAGLAYLNSDIGNAIDIATGAIVNPHTALTFEGIGLKSFTFEWSFSPSSAKESETLNSIIKRIKYHSLPSYKSPVGSLGNSAISISKGLLKYPDLVDIYFLGLDQEYFIYYKSCMIQNIGIDFTPNGQVLNKGTGGARPSFVNLVISLMENGIHTREDHDSGQ